MKKSKITFALLILLTAVYWACDHQNKEQVNPNQNIHSLENEKNVISETETRQQGNHRLAVARINPETGAADILDKRLVKHLSDGTPVKYFIIRKGGEKYGFTRIGRTAAGNYVAEAFETEIEPIQDAGNSTYSHNMFLRVVGFERLRLTYCDGTCSLCVLKGNGDWCECYDGIELEDLHVETSDGRETDIDDRDENGTESCILVTTGVLIHTYDVIHYQYLN